MLGVVMMCLRVEFADFFFSVCVLVGIIYVRICM